MCEQLSDMASIATLILFVIYFIGRIITILSVRNLWKDEIIFDCGENVGIVDEIFEDEQSNEEIHGILLSKEGIRNLKVFSVKPDHTGAFRKKDKMIYKRSFLNVNQAIAFHIMSGDIFPTLFIEYDCLDFTHVTLEWKDNLKNGVVSELVIPKHTFKSILYYLCK